MTTFEERQKILFNQLNDAEKKCNLIQNKDNSNMVHDIDRRTYRRLKNEMKQFRGRESIFKSPEAPIRHCLLRKSVPDYKKNPKNWTYYSLENVKDEDMSDQTNTATALAILKQYEESNINFNSDEDIVFKKPVFKISATLKNANSESSNDITFERRKMIMPEHIVGVSKPKIKKGKLVSRESCPATNSLKLDHLYEDD